MLNIKTLMVLFSVIEITPFRLLMPLHEAEKLHSFPYEIVYDGHGCMVYVKKRICASLTARIPGGLYLTNVADFDDVWYETFNS